MGCLQTRVGDFSSVTLCKCNRLGFLTPHPLPKKMPKTHFQRKEMPMVRRKVLTFHSWLNLAMEDIIFLGH